MTQRVSRPRPNGPHLQAAFVKMIPIIATHARVCSRHLKGDDREEFVAEVIANAFCAFSRLAALDRLSVVFPTVLARFGVAQAKVGRKVGSSLNVNDVQIRILPARQTSDP